jgi:hypothetical protein
VRTYAPLHASQARGVWTLPAGHTYRWRSEGYADTEIGPLGMPGKLSIAQRDDGFVSVALWGDSQAEGVCVADDEKLFAQAERLSAEEYRRGGRLEVYPFARSGEEAADWVTQMPAVEREVELDIHVLLIVDLDDLLAAPEAPIPPPSEADVEQANAAIAARLPAFVIQAARHLLTESDETTRRKLRFMIGPIAADDPRQSSVWGPRRDADWIAATTAIRRASEKPIVILYAPPAPQIIDGKVIVEDDGAADFEVMRVAAEAAGLIVIDTREQLRQSARQGRWPRGFHNGLIGQGHLNANGNTVVALELIDAVLDSRISLREITEIESDFSERNTTLETTEDTSDFAEPKPTLIEREN